MRYLKGVINEMREVTWPSASDINRYTVASIFMIVVVALYFTLTDSASTHLINWLVSLVNK